MTTHFMTYVKSSYELVLSAEGRACVNLDQDVEAFLVHCLARYWENANIPRDAAAISLMTAMQKTGEERKTELQAVAEECILVDGFEFKRRYWPSATYYQEMAQLALGYRASCSRPPETYYEHIARRIPDISRVLHNLNSPYGPLALR